MSDTDELKARLDRAERKIRWFYGILAIIAGVFVVTAMQDASTQDVLRTRGVVVVDDQGRERIVLGAPMGEVSQDDKLSKAVGLAVKDTSGHLHIVAGSHNPAVLPSGKVIDRVKPGSGLTIYDPRNGMERGGMGVLADGRANVCLDYSSGRKEAACMSVGPQDKATYFLLNAMPKFEGYDRAAMYLGADGTGSIKILGSGENRSGVNVVVGEGRLPSITVYDSAGEEAGELLRNQ